MVSVRVQVPLCVAPVTEFRSTDEAGRITHSHSCSIATTRAAFFIGSQKVTATLELGASADEFITHSVVEILDVNGNVIATFCASAAGTRFE